MTQVQFEYYDRAIAQALQTLAGYSFDDAARAGQVATASAEMEADGRTCFRVTFETHDIAPEVASAILETARTTGFRKQP